MSRRGAGRRRVSGARIRAPNSELRAPTAPPAPGLRLSGFGRLPGGGRLPGFGGCRATVGVGRRRVSGARIRTPSSELRPPRQPPAAGCRASAGLPGGSSAGRSSSELRTPSSDRPASPRPPLAGLRRGCWAAAGGGRSIRASTAPPPPGRRLPGFGGAVGRRWVAGVRLELRACSSEEDWAARGTCVGRGRAAKTGGVADWRWRGAGWSELGARSSEFGVLPPDPLDERLDLGHAAL